MKGVWDRFRAFIGFSGHKRRAHSVQSSLARTSFAIGDYVILRHGSRSPILTEALRPDGAIQTSRGVLRHTSIVGKFPRDVVQSQHGQRFRLCTPSLAEYINLSPRLVTPIYPVDASFIVQLLDLHPEKVNPGEPSLPLEILEAGTGHGGLTLYLARAIHAANNGLAHSAIHEVFEKTRGAIVHSVDINSGHSRKAQQMVASFRRGLYADDVKFHVAGVTEWIEGQLQARHLQQTSNKQFLDHIILDMPNCEQHVGKLATILRSDGNLVIFNPSISQIMSVVQEVHRSRLPLVLDQVVELGHGLTGGRLWDVRIAEPRTEQQTDRKPAHEYQQSDSIHSLEHSTNAAETRAASFAGTSQQGLKMVCRPLAGDRIRGGGFVAMWKRRSRDICT